jgi:hypothetical protein
VTPTLFIVCRRVHIINIAEMLLTSDSTTINQFKYIYWSRVWKYQRGNQNLYIKEEQTTQWPKEKVQKDKQQSTKHRQKTKNMFWGQKLNLLLLLQNMLMGYITSSICFTM